MTKTNLLFTGCLILLLSSCSVVNNDNFYSKKYTRFNNTQRDIAAVNTGASGNNTQVTEAAAPLHQEAPALQPVAAADYPVMAMTEPKENNIRLK